MKLDHQKSLQWQQTLPRLANSVNQYDLIFPQRFGMATAAMSQSICPTSFGPEFYHCMNDHPAIFLLHLVLMAKVGRRTAGGKSDTLAATSSH
ncbi:hypothetical protein ACTXT7_011445 [Hymenolepis weldensis]